MSWAGAVERLVSVSSVVNDEPTAPPAEATTGTRSDEGTPGSGSNVSERSAGSNSSFWRLPEPSMNFRRNRVTYEAVRPSTRLGRCEQIISKDLPTPWGPRSDPLAMSRQ